MRNMKISLLSFFTIIFCFHLDAQEEFLLNLKKDRTYCVSTSNVVTIIQELDGNQVKAINTEKGSFCYKVLADLDSLYLVETVFNHFSLHVESAETSSFFSSDKNEHSDVMSTILHGILNKPFKVWMRKDYSWKKVEGLDSVWWKSFAQFNLADDVKRQLDTVVREMLSAFTNNDQNLTSVLYGFKKVNPGEVWTTTTFAEHVVPTYDSCSYYLAETTGDLLQLKGSGVVSSTKKETTDQGITTSYELKGTTVTDVTYSKNSFWISYGTVKTEISGNSKSKDVKTGVVSLIPTRIITEGLVTGKEL